MRALVLRDARRRVYKVLPVKGLRLVDDYQSFVASKLSVTVPTGIVGAVVESPNLFEFQRDLVQWALRRGRAALFCATGLGKSRMQLTWADAVSNHTGRPVLILAPLAVAAQTAREGAAIGIRVTVCKSQDDVCAGLNIANYERLHLFDSSAFGGVVWDESSIVKSFNGKTLAALLAAFSQTPFRLACTATPSPNDYAELGNHAELLGVCTRSEMLSEYFVHDASETQTWRLKGHARAVFWQFVASWGALVRSPADLGYDASAYELPPLTVEHHVIAADEESTRAAGLLFAEPAAGLMERRQARRGSIAARVAECAALVNSDDEQWIVWCALNDESSMLADAISGAVEVTGSMASDAKEAALARFIAKEARVLVSKASICGFGINLQQCCKMAFVGVDDSWESYHQAVRREWRFGQKRPVYVHVFASELEGAVVENLKRKERDANAMAEELSAETSTVVRAEVRGTSRQSNAYVPSTIMRKPSWLTHGGFVKVLDQASGENWALYNADTVEVAKGLPTASVDFSIYSPPFASLYVYSASDRDMGNVRSHDHFFEHYDHLIREQLRVMKPGRLIAQHVMNLPTSKERDGHIGLRDFRGDIIRAYQRHGFIYHSEVCIWKDPVTAMQRTKAYGLLHKTVRKDSTMSRQGIPDYLVVMRTPGTNPDPVSHDHESFPVARWQRYASPVWVTTDGVDDEGFKICGDREDPNDPNSGIDATDTLQVRMAREHADERHLCALQIGVIRRSIRLWSAPGEVVWTPFAGIGSELYVALQEGRRAIGAELKRSYFSQAVRNCESACDVKQQTLFASAE